LARLQVLVLAIEVRVLGGEQGEIMIKKIKKRREQKIESLFNDGWNSGYEVGADAALTEAKKVFVKVLQKELRNGNIDYSDGIERAIQLIKEHK
jgi:hypothetical protein